MKIAVFGVIHGNIEALKSAYDAVLALKPGKVYQHRQRGETERW